MDQSPPPSPFSKELKRPRAPRVGAFFPICDTNIDAGKASTAASARELIVTIE